LSRTAKVVLALVATLVFLVLLYWLAFGLWGGSS
jgi:hypothetical protein